MAKYKEYGYDILDGKAIIPEWETEIKEGAFYYCEELTSVELPQWIKKIGERAFWGCSSLTEITLPEWVEEIEGGAFSLCSSLTSISIPPSVTEIGGSAFHGCFKHWVTSEVLPSIRKQGGYMVARADESDEVILARALQIMHTAMERREKEIAQNEGAENESFRKTQKYLSRFENS